MIADQRSPGSPLHSLFVSHAVLMWLSMSSTKHLKDCLSEQMRYRWVACRTLSGLTHDWPGPPATARCPRRWSSRRRRRAPWLPVWKGGAPRLDSWCRPGQPPRRAPRLQACCSILGTFLDVLCPCFGGSCEECRSLAPWALQLGYRSRWVHGRSAIFGWGCRRHSHTSADHETSGNL